MMIIIVGVPQPLTTIRITFGEIAYVSIRTFILNIKFSNHQFFKNVRIVTYY